MTDEQMLELWEQRFRKVLDLEENAIRFYQKFLSKHAHLLDGTRVKKIVRKIMHEEAKHVEIAKKLLGIVNAKKEQLKTVPPTMRTIKSCGL